MSVTISGTDFPTYATVAEADAYLSASLAGEAWTALTADGKAIRLVEATRLLDRQTWRAGYQIFAERAAVPAIVSASIEIAGILAAGETDIITSGSSEATVKREKVGPLEVEYFRSFTTAGRFPPVIMDLVGGYLAGNTSGRGFGGAFTSDTDGCSTADRPWGFTGGV